MAEAIGLIATSAQLAGLALKTFQGCKDIYDRIQDTPEEISGRFHEINDLEAILTYIKDCPELQTKDVARLLEHCGSIAQRLCQELDAIRFAADDSLGRKTWRSIVGQTKEPVICKLFEELERIKSSLSLQIELANLTQQRLVRSDIQNANSNDTDEERCLRDLFVTDPRKDRDDILDAKGNVCPGTCEWIVTTPEYQTWERDSHLLWISAPPGVGKSYMAIYLSKHLEHLAPYNYSKVLYFFCDNKKDSRNTAVNILRGLIYQLILHQRDLIGNFLLQWKVQKSEMFQESSLSILWRIFEEMIQRVNATNVYCVIDALDECEKSLPNLLQRFKALGEGRALRTKLKLICLSRRFPECIPQSLSSFTQIKLDMLAATSEDIRRFISQKAYELAQKKNLGFELQNYIEQQFLKRSNGSFLWVSFMAQDLEKRHMDEIERSLESLPQGLDAVYAGLLSQIQPTQKAMVFRLLDWIMVAVRPLRVPELCEAIDIQPIGRLSREQLCMSLIESCGHFLHIARNEAGLSRDARLCESDDELPVNATGPPNYWELEVTFIHQSAKDYLRKIRPGGQVQGANELVCTRLIRNLAEPELIHRKQFTGKSLINSPLGSYAASAWFQHFKELQDVDSMIKSNEQFFGKRSEIRKKWYFGYTDKPKDPIPLLHMACDLGLPNLARWCLERRQIQNRLGFRGHVNEIWWFETPLGFACRNRQDDIVKLLIDVGADPALDGSGSDQLGLAPFFTAIKFFGRDVLRMMAATKGGKRWLTLQSEDRDNRAFTNAAQYGNEDSCRFLIEDCGWDPNYYYSDPVEIALLHNHLELACTFVSEWHLRLSHWSVLYAASRLGDDYKFQQIINRLVRASSFDINKPNTKGCNILCEIFGSNAGDCNARMRLLLENGADATKRNDKGQTIVHCIAGGGAFFNLFRHAEAVQLLMHYGQIHINDFCEQGQTALHQFISKIVPLRSTSSVPDRERWNDIKTSLRFLLDLGADTNARDYHGYTATDILRSALHQGHLEVDSISEEWYQRSIEAGWDEVSFIQEGHKQMVEEIMTMLNMYTPASVSEYSAPSAEYSTPSAGYDNLDHEMFARLTIQQDRSEWSGRQ